jgi:hypothetical protein
MGKKKPTNGRILQEILTQMATLTERVGNIKEDTTELKDEVKKVNDIKTEVKIHRERIGVNRRLFWGIFTAIIILALKVIIF